MLRVGTNSYVNMMEADEYVEANYAPSSVITSEWNALSDERKESLLQRSAAQIDGLHFTGQRAYTEQVMAFPRINRRAKQINGKMPSSVVPEKVKTAQIENALAMLDTPENIQRNIRMSNQADGVVSFRLANFSETYDRTLRTADNSVASSLVFVYLRPWIGGGYTLV